MIKQCPNCKNQTYFEQPQKVDLSQILDRWEAETLVRFQPLTRSQYDGKISQLYCCSTCSFSAFIPPMSGTPEFYNDITIDSDYYVHEKWEFIKTRALVQKHAIKTLLDFGCGGGAFLKTITKKLPDIKADGFDENPQAAISFKDTNIGFVNSLDKNRGKTYQMITAFQILEHVEKPFATLKSLHDTLEEDGLIVVSVPNTIGPIRHYTEALTEIPPHHVNRFCYASLKQFLENENFKIEDVSYEPLSKILWDFYLPVMVEKSMSKTILQIYKSIKGPKILNAFIKLLNLSGLKTIPVKGHSIYIVARKCAG